MNKKQIILSFIPILGTMLYLLPVFVKSIYTKDLTHWQKAMFAFFLGMISFIVLFGGFALMNNLLKLNLENNLWLIYITGYLAFILWNLVFFLSYNRLTKLNA